MSTVARRTSLGVVVALIAVSPATVAVAAGKPSLCSRRICQTLAVNKKVEVFKARVRHPAHEIEFEESFARLRGGGRLLRLGDEKPGADTGIRLRTLALAGNTVGYTLVVEGGRSPALWRVYRLNVKSGKRERVAAGPERETLFDDFHAGVAEIVATPAGSLAWSVSGASTAPAERAVMEWPAAAPAPAVAAKSTTLELASLAVTPGHLYWSDAGTPHTTLLP